MNAQICNRTIFTRDNLEILRGINSKSMDLIYLDPPFNSKKTYSAPIGSQAAGAEFKDAWTLRDTDDAWLGEIAERYDGLYRMIDAVGVIAGKGDKAYLIYLAMRLLELHRILKDTGTIYLHCDPTMSHGLKLVMDAIWGKDNFRNEIVWSYRRWTATKTRLPGLHDVLLCYGSRDAVFHPILIPNDHPNRSQYVSAKDASGKTIVQRDKDGQPIKRTVSATLTVGDVWDIPMISPNGKERNGYPTQKPLRLLERIIEMSTPENGLVLDPFCGCATTCIAAERLNRRWIGIDISDKAAELVKARLFKEVAIGDEKGQPALFANVIHRTDIPVRTDIHPVRRSKDIKRILFGLQEGRCNGCRYAFPFHGFSLDHIVPKSKGGSDTDHNLQLLCGHCNSKKGNRLTMAELVVELKREGMLR